MKRISMILIPLLSCLLGCSEWVPRVSGTTHSSRNVDGTFTVDMAFNASGAHLFTGNQTQATFPDGSSEQGVDKKQVAQVVDKAASYAIPAALGGGALGAVSGFNPVIGAAAGGAVGMAADAFLGNKAKSKAEAPALASAALSDPAVRAMIASVLKASIAKNPEKCELAQKIGVEQVLALIDQLFAQ